MAADRSGRRRNALAVFARRPESRSAKTRLSALLTVEDTSRLYAAFLDDSLARLRDVPADLHLFFAPTDDPSPIGDDRFGAPASIRVQVGTSLGERMQVALDTLFAEGYARVGIVGSDLPTLPAAWVEAGLARLATYDDATVGPAADGGFYFLGLRRSLPDVFAGMSFSHRRVFLDLRRRVEQAGKTFRCLPVWYDVDEPADLVRLARELSRNPGAAPATAEALRRVGGRYGLRVEPEKARSATSKPEMLTGEGFERGGYGSAAKLKS